MKVACIQMNSGNDLAVNIEQFRSMVAEAASAGATFIATPENTFCMDSLMPEDMKVSKKKYCIDTHPGIEAAEQAAKEHGVWLLLGGIAVMPRDLTKRGKREKTYNRSVLYNPEGKKVATYDKVHLFDVDVGDGQAYRESARYLAGDAPVVAPMDKAKLGLSICYDVRFPYLYRQLAMQGADILTVPAAFIEMTGKAHWHVLLRARAIENGCFVVAPGQTGEHPGGRKTYGHSLIINPWGEVLADGGTEPGVVMAEIDLNQVQEVRSKIPSLSHSRQEAMEAHNYSI